MRTVMIKTFKPLVPLAMLFLILSGLELALEWRHFNRCFDTPIFGKKVCSDVTAPVENALEDADGGVVSETEMVYGPVPHWPFRSLVPADTGALTRVVVWVASASHAEHSRLPPDRIFPNLVCDAMKLRSDECLLVNGSRAGFAIKHNIELLEQAPEAAYPDIAVLYQMAIFVSSWQRKSADADNEEIDAKPLSTYQKTMASLRDFTHRTSIYLHLSQLIGSTIKLASFRDDSLPGVREAYIQEVSRFVEYCEERGIVPVLTTFAIPYTPTTLHLVPKTLQLTLVRENRTLSLEGYIRTINELNAAVMAFAVQEDLPLIDLASAVGGRPELFVDMVHFTKKGHRRIAETLATGLDELLTTGQNSL